MGLQSGQVGGCVVTNPHSSCDFPPHSPHPAKVAKSHLPTTTNPTAGELPDTAIQTTVSTLNSDAMRTTYCLGQFIISVSPSLPCAALDGPQVGFLQRGRREVHVYCVPRRKIGSLSPAASEHLGPLLGPISSCSTPVTSREVSPSDHALMKVRAFVVTRRGVSPELRGCVFSRSEHIESVQMGFAAADVELTPIWNYNPAVFFEIPQIAFARPQAHDETAHDAWVTSTLRRCRTTLQPHQLTALSFLRQNEVANQNPMLLWNHPTNSWICTSLDQTDFKPPAESTSTITRGSILADDMGLGKTLTALALILATSDSAVEFCWEKFTLRMGQSPTTCFMDRSGINSLGRTSNQRL
ncbi:hypothetical protein PTTG_29543 [Puccinia triticina 1-1 BBBD Race 1]|uniref:SNF2_N domain-containing protein n=1 Tax=Puccinia triticina (isolate 1-1 / race 1 (BBBD)) TaxID=630390 RepID=A0A180G3F1_PUCT1|nr:hypothetical protein PTTG_29543 [Puccinia triticina 1-1 BBBD Race 1]